MGEESLPPQTVTVPEEHWIAIHANCRGRCISSFVDIFIVLNNNNNKSNNLNRHWVSPGKQASKPASNPTQLVNVIYRHKYLWIKSSGASASHSSFPPFISQPGCDGLYVQVCSFPVRGRIDCMNLSIDDWELNFIANHCCFNLISVSLLSYSYKEQEGVAAVMLMVYKDISGFIGVSE